MTCLRLTGNRCQCPTCGDYFGSARGFDRHRIGTVGTTDRRCMTEVEMLAAGWQRNARGFLLTPDPRRAGAGIQVTRRTPAGRWVPGAMR
jgi:hypothetical protein